MEQTDPVGALYARAKAAGVPMYLICDRAGVARSTPSRWRSEKNGANLTTIRLLDDALTAIIGQRQAA
jgi:hypothetical protein